MSLFLVSLSLRQMNIDDEVFCGYVYLLVTEYLV